MRIILAWLGMGILAGVVACGGGGGNTGGSGGAGAGGSGGEGGSGATGGSGGEGGGGGNGGGGGGSACGDIVTFADGLTPTKEVHVATNGNDTTGDGSAGSPFATITRALVEVAPGTAIRVHAGTYAGGTYVNGIAGQSGAPVWIGGAPGEARPVIEGGSEGIHFTRVRYLVLHDLEVRGSTANGINADDGGDYGDPEASRFVVFRNLFLHAIGTGGNQDCLKLSGINDHFVIDSEFTGCGDGGSALDHVGCHDGVIARNYFHDLGATAVQNKGGTEDIDIRWNRFENAGARPVNMGGSTGFEFFRPPLSTSSPNAEARRIRVTANLFQGGDCAAAFVGCVDCVFAQNTVIDPQNWFFRILQETVTSDGYTFEPARNGRVENNIFYFRRGDLSASDVNVGANTAPETFSFTNNLWYAHDNADASAPTTLPVDETNGVVGQDPGFTDAGNGDYRIGASSPAAGKGKVIEGAVGDIDGACWNTPPSIGAYESK